MPNRVVVYQCSACGKFYKNYKDAQMCEEKENKCLKCANGYYVYGCEFNCKYLSTCNYNNGYSSYSAISKE